MSERRCYLPEGWVKADFEQCIDAPTGPFLKIPQKKYLKQGRFPIIDQGAEIIAGYTDIETELFKGKLPVIVFGDHTRIFKFVNFNFAIGADGTKILMAKNGINPKYLFYYLKSIDLPSRGYSRHYRYLRENKIILAPRNEQDRIVRTIDALVTRLERTKQEISITPPLFNKYRQSILAKAFSGELTKEWRGQQKDLEPVSTLLERIREERKRKLGKKFKEPRPVGTTGLPELPEGWIYAPLIDLVIADKNAIKRGPFGSAIKKAYFIQSGYKVYEQQNAIYNDFARGEYYISEKKFSELIDFEVKSGDLIVSCSGTIGKIAVAPENIERGIINQALLKLTLNNDIILTEYFVKLFNSLLLQQNVLDKSHGSGMLNISSVKALKTILFPIPSLTEQRETVDKVEELFAQADVIEKSVKIAKDHCEKLEQSILATAFRGKLVPQDPKDEPTEKLLERIEYAKKQMGNKRKRYGV